MSKISYELKDIYDYLLEQYNIEWLGYKIVDNGIERQIEKKDFGGINRQVESNLSVVAVVYNGSKRQTVWLNVSNQDLGLAINHKPKLSWKDFLARRYNQEQSL